jgi:hypothetical protein
MDVQLSAGNLLHCLITGTLQYIVFLHINYKEFAKCGINLVLIVFISVLIYCFYRFATRSLR